MRQSQKNCIKIMGKRIQLLVLNILMMAGCCSIPEPKTHAGKISYNKLDSCIYLNDDAWFFHERLRCITIAENEITWQYFSLEDCEKINIYKLPRLSRESSIYDTAHTLLITEPNVDVTQIDSSMRGVRDVVCIDKDSNLVFKKGKSYDIYVNYDEPLKDKPSLTLYCDKETGALSDSGILY